MISYFLSIFSLLPKIEKKKSLIQKDSLLVNPSFKRNGKIGVKIFLDTKDYSKLIEFLETIENKYTIVELEPFPVIFCSLYPSQILNLKVNYILED